MRCLLTLLLATTMKHAHQGKMSRMLAAKVALAVRVDALAEEDNLDVGINAKAKLENRAKAFEEGYVSACLPCSSRWG